MLYQVNMSLLEQLLSLSPNDIYALSSEYVTIKEIDTILEYFKITDYKP